MDMMYVFLISIFVLNDYVISLAMKDNTDQYQSEELDHEESQLETKSGEGNQLSASDATLLKGDINVLTNDESQAELTEEYTDEAESGNVTDSSKKLVIYQWRNGIVPYYVDAQSYDIVIYLRIRKALDAIESASCLVFKPIPKPRSGYSFVYFTNPSKERECVHKLSVGQRGEPVMVLGYDCMQERDIIHSVMHLLGFRDEVTHPHRDSYIRIMWNNIQPKYRPLFTIDTKPTWTHKLAEYDTLSVMHFHDRAFSINGGPTILPLLPDRIINPSDKLSLLDKMKLRIAFGNECKRRQVDYLVETCKNYARDDKKPKANTAENLCAFNKFKVTTVKYRQSGNERLSGIIGIQIGDLNNDGNMINNMNGINNGINGSNSFMNTNIINGECCTDPNSIANTTTNPAKTTPTTRTTPTTTKEPTTATTGIPTTATTGIPTTATTGIPTTATTGIPTTATTGIPTTATTKQPTTTTTTKPTSTTKTTIRTTGQPGVWRNCTSPDGDCEWQQLDVDWSKAR